MRTLYLTWSHPFMGAVAKWAARRWDLAGNRSLVVLRVASRCPPQPHAVIGGTLSEVAGDTGTD